jgi:hypothetical protein
MTASATGRRWVGVAVRLLYDGLPFARAVGMLVPIIGFADRIVSPSYINRFPNHIPSRQTLDRYACQQTAFHVLS